MGTVIPIATELPIDSLRVGAFRIPTDFPESDGTLKWNATTLVVVEIHAQGHTGTGYTYADRGTAIGILDHLETALLGRDAFAIEALWDEMLGRMRNLGRQGGSAMAVSAVDVALWDLKARFLNVPLVTLLGPVRPAAEVYGSGGFTSYSDEHLRTQFGDWAAQGIRRFKMKVGREPERDRDRVAAARAAIGDSAELYVDANSAYERRQALETAEWLAGEFGVRWLEEPLHPEDFAGLRFLRRRVPAPLMIAEGEYGYDLDYFGRLLAAEAVDVIMPDATRCGGMTGFLKIGVLAEAGHMPLSSHCAPSLHVALGCALPGLIHLEYFHDHARIEQRLFDGAPELNAGSLRPNLERPGLGLEFKWQDAEPFAA